MAQLGQVGEGALRELPEATAALFGALGEGIAGVSEIQTASKSLEKAPGRLIQGLVDLHALDEHAALFLRRIINGEIDPTDPSDEFAIAARNFREGLGLPNVEREVALTAGYLGILAASTGATETLIAEATEEWRQSHAAVTAEWIGKRVAFGGAFIDPERERDSSAYSLRLPLGTTATDMLARPLRNAIAPFELITGEVRDILPTDNGTVILANGQARTYNYYSWRIRGKHRPAEGYQVKGLISHRSNLPTVRLYVVEDESVLDDHHPVPDMALTEEIDPEGRVRANMQKDGLM